MQCDSFCHLCGLPVHHHSVDSEVQKRIRPQLEILFEFNNVSLIRSVKRQPALADLPKPNRKDYNGKRYDKSKCSLSEWRGQNV